MAKSFLHRLKFPIPNRLDVALIISQVLAVGWWLIAMALRGGPIPIWYDQSTTFSRLGMSLANPYLVTGFVNPPWTSVLLAPFSLLPLPVGTLIQACLYFALLTLVIYKFGGNIWTVILVCTSFIALDSVLELNIDWLVCIGLLVPPAYSAPFLLTKPQNALGYFLSFKRRDLFRAAFVLELTLAGSLLVWENWPLTMLHSIQINTLGRFYNLAPIALLPPLLAIALGILLGWYAFKRRDPVLAILAGLFFVPYITLYALPLPLAMLGIRYPRVAWIVTIAMWIIYGGVILKAALHI